MESILKTLRPLLGIGETCADFDKDLIPIINGSLFFANQLGIGPSEGFSIVDESATWPQFIGPRKDLEAIKTYIWLKTKLVWDPPQAGYLVKAIEDQIKELEWRLNAQVEGGI